METLLTGSSQATKAPTSAEVPAAAPDVVVSESQGTDSDVEVVDVKKRKLRSIVWKEFTGVEVNGILKAECMWCKDKLGGETKNGTKHLHDHLAICQSRACRKGLKQCTLRMAKAADGSVSVEKYIFDQYVVRKELSLMICLHEYPPSLVDHTGFRKFCAAMQPLFRVSSRNTIRKDIMDMHDVQRQSLVKYFQQFSHRVAITTDMWTANHQKKGYMIVTAHYIDDKWELKSFLLRCLSYFYHYFDANQLCLLFWLMYLPFCNCVGSSMCQPLILLKL